MLPSLGQGDPAQQESALQQTSNLSQGVTSCLTSYLGEVFLANSTIRARLDQLTLVHTYRDSPSIIAVSSKLQIDPNTEQGQLVSEMDILRTSQRSYASPIQAKKAEVAVQFVRGLVDSIVEDLIGQQSMPPNSVETLSSYGVILSSLEAGNGLVLIDRSNLAQVSSLDLSEEAKARITLSVLDGLSVLVPSAMIQIGGQSTIAWLEIDPVSGNVISVSEDVRTALRKALNYGLLPR